MTYQALARRWRPRTFTELVGQAHVVTALTNALTRGRIHHAYLLTGTRGVGKTTLARILAKSLNCETGVTAAPCGHCAACRAIDEGRFVDLLELDAASNTGVDNMREILDNARYAPTIGRYKVYLIDEVHMLSTSAFNSMLKTLEEPPEHVKFVLATTDPQKVPITVLSRCLQFALKSLPVEVIRERLGFILNQEEIPFEDKALALIARSARGSLRDALSLLDQAVAYGAGRVEEAGVTAMLGLADHEGINRLLEALAAGDGETLLSVAEQMVVDGMDVTSVLDELASIFHRVAIAQVVPKAVAAAEDAQRLQTFAQRFTPEEVQLFYQIALQGRADLPLAPDETMGLSMTLLRLLAFTPLDSRQAGAPGTAPTGKAVTSKAPGEKPESVAAPIAPVEQPAEQPAAPSKTAEVNTESHNETKATLALPANPADWAVWIEGVKLSGLAAQLAANTELSAVVDNELQLALPEAHRHLSDNKNTVERLRKALATATGLPVRLKFTIVSATDASLAAQQKQAKQKARAELEGTFVNDPFVQALNKEGGTVLTETIREADKGDAKRD